MSEAKKLETKKPDPTADSRLFLRRATWCGVVFSLAVLLTALNLFPPFAIHYRVRSEVVISASRLPQLKAIAERDRKAVADGRLKNVQLVGLTVLDRSTQSISGHADVEQEIVLVEINSLWTGQCSGPSHNSWIKEITKATPREMSETEVAKQNRFAKWELAAAEHYATRHEFLSNQAPTSTSTDGRTFELSSQTNAGGVPASLASYQTDSTPENTADQQEAIRHQLQQDVDRANDLVSQTELAWREQIEQSSGIVEIATSPRITTYTNPIPVWMTASVLILGLASGSLAGWFQHRLQSGGAYEPNQIADRLQLEGVPFVGTIELPMVTPDSGWSNSTASLANQVTKRSYRNLTRLSEWALAFWVLFIAMRLLMDPIWRGVFMENPLAALGRALVGLP